MIEYVRAWLSIKALSAELGLKHAPYSYSMKLGARYWMVSRDVMMRQTETGTYDDALLVASTYLREGRVSTVQMRRNEYRVHILACHTPSTPRPFDPTFDPRRSAYPVRTCVVTYTYRYEHLCRPPMLPPTPRDGLDEPPPGHACSHRGQ